MPLITLRKEYMMKEYLSEIKHNLREGGLLTALFKYKIADRGSLWILWIEPVYPELYKIGFVITAAAFLFKNNLGLWSLLLYSIGGLGVASGVFWMRQFYAILVWLGLRKTDYKGNIEFLTPEELAKEVLYGTI